MKYFFHSLKTTSFPSSNFLFPFFNFTARSVLIRYYHAKQNDLEEAKNLLDGNVKFRLKHQFYFTDRRLNTEEFRRSTKAL